jgi:drug/metabolite transporter (DMT)-like permease
MIQRKQSIWLLLAALINACLFVTNLYTAQTVVNGVTTETNIRVVEHYPLLIAALVITILPLIDIFMFKNRHRQGRICVGVIICTLAFISMVLAKVTNLDKLIPPPTSGSYKIGAVLPIVSLILVIMAYIAVRKDEKLVRSMDRLR